MIFFKGKIWVKYLLFKGFAMFTNVQFSLLFFIFKTFQLIANDLWLMAKSQLLITGHYQLMANC